MKGSLIILILLTLTWWPKSAASQNISVPKSDLIIVRDAAYRVKDLEVDVKYYQTENEKLKQELALANAQIAGKESIIQRLVQNESRYIENTTILKQQVNRLKKDKRFSLGPFAGMVIGQGEIPHPAVGVGLTFSVVSFGRF